MRTLNISVSEFEYEKFGLRENNLSFSELLDIIEREIMRGKLLKSVQMAEKNGLSKITMEEIDEEIKAVRTNAKSDN
jgi:cell division FtsZ-interacting protein ZapD